MAYNCVLLLVIEFSVVTVDRFDKALLTALQRYGRISNVELASLVNLSESACLRRVRALEEKGVIKGYTAIVDERAYGLPVTALVRIRLSSHTGDVVKLFEKKVHETEQILDCYVITGRNQHFDHFDFREVADRWDLDDDRI